MDFKCEDCGGISEIVIRADDGSEIKCSKCGSIKMVRVFSPIGFRSSSGSESSRSASSCSTCSGGSCSTCGCG